MKIYIMLGILFVGGCANEPASPDSAQPADVKRIPAVSSLPNCDPTLQTVASLCEWTAGTDAVVVGLVQSVEPVFFPAYVMWEDAPRSSCEATVEPAMKIKLAVEKTLHGTPMETLDVYIGRDQRLLFDPQPVLENNAFKWSNTHGIEPGQRLGFGLVESGGIWTPNYRDFFEVYEDAVAFQSKTGESCAEHSPLEINGLTLAAVEGRIGACDFSDPDLGQDLKHFDEAATLRRQAMGLCWDDSPNPEPDCITDTDCSIGEVCANESCVSE